MKTGTYIIFFLLFISCCNQLKDTTDINASDKLTYIDYYPDHTRPSYLYHGADNFIINEKELLLSLLGIRNNIIVNNYTLSILSSEYDTLLNNYEYRMQLLRSEKLGKQIVDMNVKMIQKLKKEDLIYYLIDYNFSDSTKPNINFYGGEGYLPLPEQQEKEYITRNGVLDVPLISAEPNDLLYNIPNYPKFYRFSIYTSEHFKTACLFGEIVLKIKDSNKRGLSLGRYAQYKYGHDILFSDNCISFNGATNIDEYVFPGVIYSSEVVEAYIIKDFKKIEYTSSIKRTYQKVLINDQPVVTCFAPNGRALFQAVEKNKKVIYNKYKHANGKLQPVDEIDHLLNEIEKYNESI